ncbi:MAG: DEAD/DEAH box helicase family protein [Azoarcus sp.]|nr:DEAD/DEAH box helicase family protein [Azoarcus sp.]
MNAFTHLLETLRNHAQSEREKGAYFERLVQIYLTHEPYYAGLYGGKVWLWEAWRREWMRRGNADPGADAGIDLVAETATGELHAIQAKFYADDACLTLNDLATFFVASGKKHFSHRLIFLTATKATTPLREAVKNQNPPVTLVSSFDMEQSRIDWPRLDVRAAGEAVPLKAVKTLRPYQQKAIDDVLRGLESAERGKLIMACGTGKTFTTLRLAEKMVASAGNVLFLVPSLNLMSQTLTEWTQEAETPLRCYAVCSDSQVGKRGADGDDFALQMHDLQYPATTNAEKLAKAFLLRRDGDASSARNRQGSELACYTDRQRLRRAKFLNKTLGTDSARYPTLIKYISL